MKPRGACCEAGLGREVAGSVIVCMEWGMVLGLLSSGLHSFWISPSVCLGFPCKIKNAVGFCFFMNVELRHSSDKIALLNLVAASASDLIIEHFPSETSSSSRSKAS